MSLTIVTAMLLGCSPSPSEGNVRAKQDDYVTIEEDSVEEAAVLSYLNDAGTTYTVLVDVVASVAANIVYVRNGDDGLFPSEDDFVFASIREVDMLGGVDRAALDALYRAALAAGFDGQDDVTEPGDEVLEMGRGIYFTPEEAAGVLEFANASDAGWLEETLLPETAAAIVDNRPFESIGQMQETDYLVRSTWTVLRDMAIDYSDEPEEVQLAKLVEGYTVISEGDSAIDVFRIEGGAPDGEIDASNIKDLIASVHVDDDHYEPLDNRVVEVLDAQQWWDDQVDRSMDTGNYSLEYWGERGTQALLMANEAFESMPGYQLFYLGQMTFEGKPTDMFWGGIDAYMVAPTDDGDLLVLHWEVTWT